MSVHRTRESEKYMLKTGCDILFLDPQFEVRTLRHSAVIEVDSESFIVELDDSLLALTVDEEVTVYFDDCGEFMQQCVRVREIVREAPRPVVALVPIGDATSAESRQNYRVSTISAEIHAKIADETQCTVQDISSTGFSVVARESYEVGSTLEASIGFEGDFFDGTVSVQSAHELRPGHLRYGLKALEEGLHASELLDGLRQINFDVQRSRPKRNC